MAKKVTDEEIKSLDNYQTLESKFNDLRPKTITSIVGHRNKKINVYRDVVDALFSEKDKIQHLLDNGFKLKNLSSILNGSGSKAGEAIESLAKNKDTLLSLISGGLKAENLSSILHGSGSKAGEKIKKLYQQEKIKKNRSEHVEKSDTVPSIHPKDNKQEEFDLESFKKPRKRKKEQRVAPRLSNSSTTRNLSSKKPKKPLNKRNKDSDSITAASDQKTNRPTSDNPLDSFTIPRKKRRVEKTPVSDQRASAFLTAQNSDKKPQNSSGESTTTKNQRRPLKKCRIRG